MASEACIAAFDKDIEARRNRRILGDHAEPGAVGWRVDQAPFRVADVVGLLAMAFGDDGLRDASAAPYAVALGCSLVGELLATVYTDKHMIGGIFEIVDKEKDRRRHEKQLPLLMLRNALCHPGYLPAPVNDRSKIDGLLDVIRDDYGALRKRLERSRLEIMSIELARWAVDRVHELGQFELCKLIVAKLRSGGVAVSDLDARRLEQSSKFKAELEVVLSRARSVSW
jgi:hypothetical protein